MFDIILQKNKSDKNQLIKDIEEIRNTQGVLKDATSKKELLNIKFMTKEEYKKQNNIN